MSLARRELVALSRPMDVTFHRAFDMAADFVAGAGRCVRVRISWLLTSGASKTSLQGQGMIGRIW